MSIEQRKHQWISKALRERYPTLLRDEKLMHEHIYNGNSGLIIPIDSRKFVQNDPTVSSDKCRSCCAKSETIEHIIAGCSILTPSEYLRRVDNFAQVIFHKLSSDKCILCKILSHYKL